MDFSYSQREEGFRRELLEWLAVNVAEHRRQFPPSDDELTLHPDKAFDSSLACSHYSILLVRTDPQAPKHRGISCVLVDMRSPGVTIRPLVQITGEAEFNEVFFDQVRVPKANLLGSKNGGWEVAITVLMYERMAIGSTVILHHYIQRLLELARGIHPRGLGPRDEGVAAADPVLRQELAQIYLEGRVLRLTGLRYLTRQLRGEAPGPEGSVLKLTLTPPLWLRGLDVIRKACREDPAYGLPPPEKLERIARLMGWALDLLSQKAAWRGVTPDQLIESRRCALTAVAYSGPGTAPPHSRAVPRRPRPGEQELAYILRGGTVDFG